MHECVVWWMIVTWTLMSHCPEVDHCQSSEPFHGVFLSPPPSSIQRWPLSWLRWELLFGFLCRSTIHVYIPTQTNLALRVFELYYLCIYIWAYIYIYGTYYILFSQLGFVPERYVGETACLHPSSILCGIVLPSGTQHMLCNPVGVFTHSAHPFSRRWTVGLFLLCCRYKLCCRALSVCMSWCARLWDAPGWTQLQRTCRPWAPLQLYEAIPSHLPQWLHQVIPAVEVHGLEPLLLHVPGWMFRVANLLGLHWPLCVALFSFSRCLTELSPFSYVFWPFVFISCSFLKKILFKYFLIFSIEWFCFFICFQEFFIYRGCGSFFWLHVVNAVSRAVAFLSPHPM